MKASIDGTIIHQWSEHAVDEEGKPFLVYSGVDFDGSDSELSLVRKATRKLSPGTRVRLTIEEI